jgi:hypothetical protein
MSHTYLDGAMAVGLEARSKNDLLGETSRRSTTDRQFWGIVFCEYIIYIGKRFFLDLASVVDFQKIFLG